MKNSKLKTQNLKLLFLIFIFLFIFARDAFAISDIRRPTGDTADKSGTWTYTSGSTMWNLVDEDPADDADYATTPTAAGGAYQYLSYSALSVPSIATIIDVTVTYRCKDASSGSNNMRAAIKVGGTLYGTTDAGANPSNTGFTDRSYAFTTNPKSVAAWTVDDVNGIGTNALQAFGVNSSDASPAIQVSQVYMTVNYTVPFPNGLMLMGVGPSGGDGTGRYPTDNFNRADANPIGGNWTTVTGQSAMQIVSNQAKGSSTGFNGAYYNAQAFNDSQYVQAKGVTFGTGSWSITCRQSSSANTNYYLLVGNTSWSFGKTIAGTGSTIGAEQTKTIADGTVARLDCSGGNPVTLKAFFNGAQEAYTQTDSSISSGSPGVTVYGNSAVYDDWEGGNL